MTSREPAKSFIAIDLKSFYASVECIERKLDPLRTNLVVADASRTEKTICLAVSPTLKALGIPGRARLFEVIQQVSKANALRKAKRGGTPSTGISCDAKELEEDPEKDIGFVTAVPRMSLYMEYSTRIIGIYLKYAAREDIHVYSVDEVMIDASPYLKAAGMSAREMCAAMIRDVAAQTGLTAAGGVGTNLYLCKVAMDIMAKHTAPDEEGVRIAELDETSYRRYFWAHRPLTDFWRVGRGTASKLDRYGIRTMGDIAVTSLENPDLLYKLLGINAELLIDHAWGRETATMESIRYYRPASESTGSGQVLPGPYTALKARLIVSEMAEELAMELFDKQLVTDQIVLTAGYDISNLTDPDIAAKYKGEIVTDWYGRKIPKHAHGTIRLPQPTNLAGTIISSSEQLYDSIIDEHLLVRRIFITAGHTAPAGSKTVPGSAGRITKEPAPDSAGFEQMSLFDVGLKTEGTENREDPDKLNRVQQAMADIRRKFGAGAVMRGRDLEEGATAADRKKQIGGHKA